MICWLSETIEIFNDDELPTSERSGREGEYAHRACFLHFHPLVLGKVTEDLGIVPADV